MNKKEVHEKGVLVKRKMTIGIVIGMVVIIIIAAIILLRPSSWSDSGEKTKVTLTVNGKSVPAEFNSTSAAKAVIAQMPFTISFTPSAVDYCGSLGFISYEQKDVHAGWANGDIIYMTNGNWFSIFSGGQNSVVPGNVTLGHISDEYLGDVKAWKEQGSVQITFELAVNDEEQNSLDTYETESVMEGDMMTSINLTINNQVLTAELANNTSAEALVELLQDGPLTINMRDYEKMEKVGSVGTSLPTNNEQITTEAGDLILYMGNALVIYYAPNSWNFTRLGKIQNVTADELKEILGDGDVTVTLSLID